MSYVVLGELPTLHKKRRKIDNQQMNESYVCSNMNGLVKDKQKKGTKGHINETRHRSNTERKEMIMR